MWWIDHKLQTDCVRSADTTLLRRICLLLFRSQINQRHICSFRTGFVYAVIFIITNINTGYISNNYHIDHIITYTYTTVFDASAKLPSGIENGAVYQFGNFDECMSTVAEPLAVQQPHQQSDVIISSRDGSTTSLSPSASIVIESQYCLAKVHAVGYTVRKAANRHFQVGSRSVAETIARQFTPIYEM